MCESNRGAATETVELKLSEAALKEMPALTNALLAINLFSFSPVAWYFAIGWLTVGTIAYLAHFSKIEEMEKPNEILQEEVLVSRDYSIVVPVATQGENRR